MEIFSYPPEVGSTFSVRSLFDQLVNTIKMVSHRLTVIDIHHDCRSLFFGLLELKNAVVR